MWARNLSPSLVFCCILTLASSSSQTERILQEKIDNLEKLVGIISRQVMMQQFYVEEQTRANGNSGLKQIRNTKTGTRPYYTASHADSTCAAIHDHANLFQTIGMGELIVVLNGVEFRTRHNDYMLVMKSQTSSEYGATEDIPLPGVPPEVTQFMEIDNQVAELKEWFRAWRDQDYSVRDYRPYFKPVLCYMEGQWTHSDQNDIEEPFDSDRHHLDAKSWLDLQEKIRFTSYSGTKENLENFAYLPTTIFSIQNETTPILTQWNFKILCHPLSRDLPLNRLRAVDDLKTRVAHDLTFEEYANSRSARFQVSNDIRDTWTDKAVFHGLLDELMEEIPGPDNYPGRIADSLMGDTVYPYDTTRPDALNVAYYHRAYRLEKAGAMGLKIRRRGFSDENMFLAQTTNPKVAGLPVEKCVDGVCNTWFQRWSYAIPLEIIYTTPLAAWNPYNIEYKGKSNQKYGRTVLDGPNGRRDGSESLDKAYDGTNSKIYYRTPLDFFEDATYSDPADTTVDYTCVLDRGGNIRRVRASGTRIFLPEIPGVGILRQRYPIMPIHGEGSSVWKELEALKDLVMSPSQHEAQFRTEVPLTTLNYPNVRTNPFVAESNVLAQPPPVVMDTAQVTKLHFKLHPSSAVYGTHTHHFELSEDQTKSFIEGHAVSVITEEANAHSHELLVYLVHKDGVDVEVARRCDGELTCWDGHKRQLIRVVE